ncbi:MAG: TolC family protein [Planctomycetales bacterium]|nr:TolC family protein [Planctomycetales bacterium]
MLLACLGGCNRGKYRQAADAEAHCLINEKSVGPNWNLDNYNVYPNAASRMFDPFAPDREPMPPDDPISHRFMHFIDGKKGFPHWHKFGDTDQVQNPAWMAHMNLDEDGVVRVDEFTALQLARLHSTDYQTELEDLFLSALDVSTERFRFDTQLFGGYQVDYTTAGPQAVGSSGTARSVLGLSTRSVQARRFFTTGAELVAGFANSLVWQFSGTNSHNANTLIDFTFLQPLLRNAGRDRILERLTIAERTLLANVRQMEWYRKGFYLDILTGRGSQTGPSRRGGVFGAGLSGFTGTGGGFFTGGGGNTGGGGGGGGLGGSTAGGFLGLLQTQQTLRNEEANIASLRSSLTQLEAFRPSGRIDYFQVEQVRQQLYDNTSRFLANKQAYQNTLDSFKQTLGLPPQLRMRIDDDKLGQFNLIDPEITPLQDLLAELQREVGATLVPMLISPEPGKEQQWRDVMTRGLRKTQELIAAANELRREVLEESMRRALADVSDLEKRVPQRLEMARSLQELAKLPMQDPTEVQLMQYVDESLFDTEYLENLPVDIREKLGEIKQRLEELGQLADQLGAECQSQLENIERVTDEQLAALSLQLRERLLQPFPAMLTDLSTEFLQVSLEQARARTERITLPAVDIGWAVALEVARENRLDWMNARAALVDAWRLLEFNADDLEGVLNLVVSGDVTNYGDNPFRMGHNSGRLRMGIEFDAPFTRLQERNIYREALIDFQRARRNYYRYEDNIAASLRLILRQVSLDRVNFELRRRALRVAVEQVRLARLELLRPPQTEGDRLGPTTAQNLINALNSLRNAQDAYLNVWVDYEIQRKLLDLSMGTMTLTNEGVWVDPGAIGLEFGYPAVSAEILSACSYDPVQVAPVDAGGLEELPGVESVEPGAGAGGGAGVIVSPAHGPVPSDSQGADAPAGLETRPPAVDSVPVPADQLPPQPAPAEDAGLGPRDGNPVKQVNAEEESALPEPVLEPFKPRLTVPRK